MSPVLTVFQTDYSNSADVTFMYVITSQHDDEDEEADEWSGSIHKITSVTQKQVNQMEKKISEKCEKLQSSIDQL